MGVTGGPWGNFAEIQPAVVLGRSANGRIEWRDAQGRMLKALQEAETGT